MKKFAFFDVDNTIYNGYTAGDFLAFLDSQDLINKTIYGQVLQATDDYLSKRIDYNEISQRVLDLASLAVKEKTISEIETLVGQFFKNKKEVFKPWVEEVVKHLEKKDYKIILISAGPEYMIKEIAKLIKADKYYATSIEIIDDKYTGKETHLIHNGEKLEIIKKLTLDKDTRTIGFGDSTGDIPMLEYVDQAFVVKNDHHTEMIDYAHKKNWIVFDGAEKVIDSLS